uniref:Uncharacterized protein n=1 Tax=Streptomyces sp. F12 TaxID=1436084 RepID=V9Z8G5_9ACTN|nr:hypothetical protein [Streptomyces sp. F12]AHE40393.1 Hypothetical protein pFRL6_306 [Streptomyces sp. F12]
MISNTSMLAAESSAITDVVGRIGAGGVAFLLGAILYLGLSEKGKTKLAGKLKKKPGAVIIIGILFAAACAKAGGFWDLFTSLANIPADIMREDLGMGDMGPAVPPLLAIIVLALTRPKPGAIAFWAFFLYITCAGAGRGSLWDIIGMVTDKVLAKAG